MIRTSMNLLLAQNCKVYIINIIIIIIIIIIKTYIGIH